MVGSLELLPEGVGLEEPREMLLLVKPGMQGVAQSGVARRWTVLMGSMPIEQAVEALEEGVRQADTDDLGGIRGFARHRFPSFFSKHYRV